MAFEHLFPQNNLTVKGSINSNFGASFLFRFPSILFKDIAKTSVGLHGSDLLSDKRAFKYGLQVEFNV